MAKVTVTKNRIAKAILTEPALLPGAWAILQDGVEQKLWNEGKNASLTALNLKSKDCSVCAVGAVMRNILDPDQTADSIDTAATAAVADCGGYDVCGTYWESEVGVQSGRAFRDEVRKEAVKILKDGYPMVALSFLFETLGDYYKEQNSDTEKLTGRQIGIIRRLVVEFVRKNFPAKVDIYIDGQKPAKDVKRYSSSVRV